MRLLYNYVCNILCSLVVGLLCSRTANTYHGYLQIAYTLNVFETTPCSFSATHVYSPLSVISSAVKIRTLSLLELGQDEQGSGNDQLYTGSGDADTVQFSISSSPKMTVTACVCSDTSNFGGPAQKH